MSRSFEDSIHEAFRPADVEMRSWLRLSEQRRKVESLHGIAIIQVKRGPLRECLDPLTKRHPLFGACAVVEIEVFAGRGQSVSHAKYGRDADATCEQKMSLRTMRKREVIPWWRDDQGVPFVHSIMQCL